MSKKVKFSLSKMVMDLIPTGFVAREVSKAMSSVVIKRVIEEQLAKIIRDIETSLDEGKKRGQTFLLLIVAASLASFLLNHFALFPASHLLHRFLWCVTLIPIFYSMYALFFIWIPKYYEILKSTGDALYLEPKEIEKGLLKGMWLFNKEPLYSYYRIKNFLKSSYPRQERGNGFLIITVGAVVTIVYCIKKEHPLVGGVESIGFLDDYDKIVVDNCGQLYDTANHIVKTVFRSLFIMLLSVGASMAVKTTLAWQFNFLPYWPYLAGFGVVVILVLWNFKQRAVGRLICGMCTYRWR